MSNSDPQELGEVLGRAKLAHQTTERLDAAVVEYRQVRSRAIAELVYVHGVSQSEVARQLNMSVPRVRELAMAAKHEVQPPT